MQKPQPERTDPFIGKDLGTQPFVVDDKLLADYFAGLEIDPAWYRDQSPYDRPLAPSMIVTVLDDRFARGAWFKHTFGTLWMRQEYEFHQHVFQGERYEASAKVLDIYEHRNRTVVNMEVTVRSLDGRLVAVGRHHQSFVLDQSSGMVALRDPRAKEGVRSWEPPHGKPFGPVQRTMTVAMCRRFFGLGENYHTQKLAAERMGFGDIVVGGRMTVGLLGDLLDKRFGKGWYEGGRLSIKFTNVVWPGDAVRAQGVITKRTPDGPGSRCELALWLEKADGTMAIVGTGAGSTGGQPLPRLGG